MLEIPGTWGEWRPCSSCGVLMPPRATVDGICSDKEWCSKAQLKLKAARVIPEPQIPTIKKVLTPKKKKK